MSTAPLLRVPGIRDPLTDALWTEEDEVSAANWSEFDALLAATEVSAVRRAPERIYGLPATKTLPLCRGQICEEGDALNLLLGDRPLKLPEPIADLARAQLGLRPGTNAEGWLFPGRGPGRPLDPQYLTLRLRALGTSISALQNTARSRLAGAVPAKVLADMLDFSFVIFEDYARLSGGTRGEYPALRASHRGSPGADNGYQGVAEATGLDTVMLDLRTGNRAAVGLPRTDRF